MNKYVESDIHNGTVYFKCAIMNVLKSLLSGDTLSYNCGKYVPYRLFIKCLKEFGFEIEEYSEAFKIPNMENEYICWDDSEKGVIISREHYE